MKRLLIALLLAGCSSGVIPTSNIPQNAQAYTIASRYIYVSNRQTETVTAYPFGSSVASMQQPLQDAGGVSVDKVSGNVYVANGRNVVEYAPGLTHLVRTFSTGLVDAVNVTVANGSVYVADDGTSGIGAAGKIVIFGKNARTIGTSGNWYPHALAVDSKGDLFFEISGIGDVAWPFDVDCLAINLTYELPAGSDNAVQIGIRNHPKYMKIKGRLEIVGEQDWGFSLQGTTLYVSDACLGVVAAYYPPAYGYQTKKYIGTWPNLPLYPSVDNGMLAIPQARTGQVFAIDLSGSNDNNYTLNTNVPGVVGVAISP